MPTWSCYEQGIQECWIRKPLDTTSGPSGGDEIHRVLEKAIDATHFLLNSFCCLNKTYNEDHKSKLFYLNDNLV